jgi:hypothetical protein
MKLTIAYKGKEYDYDPDHEATILDVKNAVNHATKLPPEALKVFFRGRPRPDSDKLILIGVKQFSKLVLVGNPNWTPPGSSTSATTAAAAAATTSGAGDAPKSKLDELLDSLKPLEDEAAAALSAGKTTLRQKLWLQELLTQKMLALDAIEVEGQGRERRKKAIQKIEKLCTDIEGVEVD